MKLLSGYIALTFMIVLLTALVSFFLVRQYTLNSNMHDLLQKAETIADMAAKPGGTTRVLASGRIAEYQEICDARLIYIDEEMKINRAPTDGWQSYDGYPDFEPADVVDPLDVQLWDRLLGGHTVTDVRMLEFMESEVVFAAAPIREDEEDEVQGAILLYRPLHQVSATAESIVLMLALAGAVAVIVAIALAYFMGKRFSRPLVLINNAAKQISEGHYDERVQIEDRDEVGQLGATLNLLSERLSAVIQNLNEEKSKLEQILESLGEGIIAIDRDGRIIHHNPSALKLLHLPDLSSPDAQGPDAHMPKLLDMLTGAMNEKRHVQTSLHHGGRTIEAICSPISGEGGLSLGAVCLLRDISEAQRLEQMRRDYIANISHELRTPLTGIRGMVEPLLDDYIDTEAEKQECYRVIYQETMRLERLIGEMLDLSRLQDGRARMELEPMEAMPLLQAAKRRVQERANECGVRLTVKGDERLKVMGNEDRILQVLMILLDNALSFTPSGGSIALRAEQAGEMVRLSVRDTGSGIDPKDLPYIWERFFKADRSRLRTQGVGLGLAIAKLIVEVMGGSISVETVLHVGSTFTIALKRAY